jgi:hypothetical protein
VKIAAPAGNPNPIRVRGAKKSKVLLRVRQGASANLDSMMIKNQIFKLREIRNRFTPYPDQPHPSRTRPSHTEALRGQRLTGEPYRRSAYPENEGGGGKNSNFLARRTNPARFSPVKHTYLSLDTYMTETVTPIPSGPGFAPSDSAARMALSDPQVGSSIMG